ncbi:hypothetical protein D9M68_918670 [compost metagenome]
MSNRRAVAGTGQAQVFQGRADFRGQACSLFVVQAGSQQAEFTAAITRCQPGPSFRQLSHASEQLSDGADQCIGTLTAQALIEAGQVVDLQHQQVSVAALFADPQVIGQLLVQQAAVG